MVGFGRPTGIDLWVRRRGWSLLHPEDPHAAPAVVRRPYPSGGSWTGCFDRYPAATGARHRRVGDGRGVEKPASGTERCHRRAENRSAFRPCARARCDSCHVQGGERRLHGRSGERFPVWNCAVRPAFCAVGIARQIEGGSCSSWHEFEGERLVRRFRCQARPGNRRGSPFSITAASANRRLPSSAT
jgi:hypothetical protein